MDPIAFVLSPTAAKAPATPWPFPVIGELPPAAVTTLQAVIHHGPVERHTTAKLDWSGPRRGRRAAR
jgi:hypothetical protein